MSSAVGNGTTKRMTFKCGTGARTTTSQYRVAYISGSMTVCVSSAAADEAVGIIDSMQSAGSEYCSVITSGLALGVMHSATTCVIGAWLVANTEGSLDIPDTVTTDNVVVGRALSVPASGGTVMVMVNIHPTILG